MIDEWQIEADLEGSGAILELPDVVALEMWKSLESVDKL